jgi:hypothetical protein
MVTVSLPASDVSAVPQAFAPGAAPPATFGIGPANATGVDGRPFLNYLSNPGGRLADNVALVNLATTPAKLNVYVVDVENADDGSLAYQPKSAPKKDAANWLTLKTPHGASTVTMRARSTMIVPLMMSVPASASPGDHAAAVIASLTSTVKSSRGVLVPFEQRVALRTFIRVSGPLHPALSVVRVTASYHGTLNPVGSGRMTVQYMVRNTGNVKLGGRQRVSVSGLFGSAGQAHGLPDIPMLLPGSSVPVTATIPSVFPGIRLVAKVNLTPVPPPTDADPAPVAHSGSAAVWAIPWTLLGLIALILGLGIFWFIRRRHRRRPPGAANVDRPADAEPTAPVGV